MSEEQTALPVMYTNSVRISYSIHDFSILMGVAEPPLGPPVKGKKEKTIHIRPLAQAVMSPSHFKRFLEVGNGMLEGYEKQYGKVPVKEKRSRS